ncbi:MAG TPA: hypothetical protein ENG99_00300 [bacterium]|nr:hypothetical protein [bacterium]
MKKVKTKKSLRIEWRAPEYEYMKKTADWFWIVGIVTLALISAAIFLGNVHFAILAGLAGFSIALYGARKPKTINFSISSKGIQIGNKIYDYENLNSFWINYAPPHRKELIIESNKTFMPHINIMLGETNPEKIHEYLLQFLKEEKIEESLIITIARLIGF